MATFLTFDQFDKGQYVKIAGKTLQGKGFLAVEVVLEPAESSPKLEGEVQSVDTEKQQIHTFNRELKLNGQIEIKSADDQPVALSQLQPGSVLKIKGKYVNGQGFVPKKIKMKEAQEFNIEEMQGALEDIDRTRKTFTVNGVTVFVNDKTICQTAS